MRYGRRKRRISPELREQALRRDGYTCTACQRTNCRLELHHVLAEFEGGKTVLSNLQSLCRSCHWKETRAQNDKRYPLAAERRLWEQELGLDERSIESETGRQT